MEAPELQFQAEGVEFDSLQARRYRGQLGQLLVGHPLRYSGQDEKAEQAVQAECDGDCVEGSLQSFGHGTASSSSRLRRLEYGMGRHALWASTVPLPRLRSAG